MTTFHHLKPSQQLHAHQNTIHHHHHHQQHHHQNLNHTQNDTTSHLRQQEATNKQLLGANFGHLDSGESFHRPTGFESDQFRRHKSQQVQLDESSSVVASNLGGKFRTRADEHNNQQMIDLFLSQAHGASQAARTSSGTSSFAEIHQNEQAVAPDWSLALASRSSSGGAVDCETHDGSATVNRRRHQIHETPSEFGCSELDTIMPQQQQPFESDLTSTLVMNFNSILRPRMRAADQPAIQLSQFQLAVSSRCFTQMLVV